MWCRVEQAGPLEEAQVPWQVVNQVVRAQNALIPAEHVVRRRNEREVALQPAVFGAERIGNGHGLGGDEDLEAKLKVFKYLLGTGHQRQILEKVFGIEEFAEL